MLCVATLIAGLILLGIEGMVKFGGATRVVLPEELKATAIGNALLAYSRAHYGKYPTGNSATEIFQQLLDAGYINDPTVFWLDLPDKKKPDSNILKPNNVCWDITIPFEQTLVAKADRPMVFTTGYKIDYLDGKAVWSPKPSWWPRAVFVFCYTDGTYVWSQHDFLYPINKDMVADFGASSLEKHSLVQELQQLTPEGSLSTDAGKEMNSTRQP